MRQIVQLHTIEQWFAQPELVRSTVLQHIKLRDRLWSWLMAREQARSIENDGHEDGWIPCRHCDKRGWKPKRPRRLGLHPSSMGGTCLLKMHKELRGEPQAVVHEADVQLIFDLGTAIHDMFQEYGEDGAWGEQYQKEVDIGETPLAKKYRIQGHADADNILVVDNIAGDWPVFEVGLVHEYKSINKNGFESLKNRPMPKHQQQAVVYSACKNRPVVVYLYFCKDNSKIQDFPIPFSSQLWEVMQAKASKVLENEAAEQWSPGDVGYNCKQCGYYYTCEARKAVEKS